MCTTLDQSIASLVRILVARGGGRPARVASGRHAIYPPTIERYPAHENGLDYVHSLDIDVKPAGRQTRQLVQSQRVHCL